MIRKIFALLVGLLVAVLTVGLVEEAGHIIIPPPTGVDMSDPDAIKAVIRDLPLAAFLFVLAAWFFGTFAGAYTALKIARSRQFIFAAIVAAFILIAAVVTTTAIPHPFWFMATAIIGIPLSGWLAWRIVNK